MEATKDTKVEGDFSAEGDDAFSSTSRSFDFYHNLSERQHRTLAEKTPPTQAVPARPWKKTRLSHLDCLGAENTVKGKKNG